MHQATHDAACHASKITCHLRAGLGLVLSFYIPEMPQMRGYIA